MVVRFVYFLLFFSFVFGKTLTKFNIHAACFRNYNWHTSDKNTNNFYKVTKNFSFSPSNFTDF